MIGSRVLIGLLLLATVLVDVVVLTMELTLTEPTSQLYYSDSETQ